MRGSRLNLVRWLILLLALAVLYGVGGYMFFEGWNLADSLYMTLLVLSTVGFKEVRPLDTSGRTFTATLIVIGVALVLVTVTVLALWVTEENLWASRRKKRMQKRIEDMKDHYIICAYGRVGRAVARDLEEEGVPFVVVDPKEELEERMLQDEVAYLVEDPSAEEVLVRAGLDRAKGLICAVDSDATNVYITLMARSMNPDILIVARASEPGSDVRLQKAGANRVVSPFVSSGRHMALMSLRPEVVDAVEFTSRSRKRPMWVEELLVDDDSALNGATVATARGASSALALRSADGDVTTGPSDDLRLRPGDLLLLLGDE
ncbi:MAG: potassium channel family protein [Actinobacteria bacterium]|nr:potassium channel family protein [Actinomycetota bacterium]